MENTDSSRTQKLIEEQAAKFNEFIESQDISEYEEDMAINPLRLDNEWLGQPNLFMKYGVLQSKAKAELAMVHEKLKVTRSRLVKECKTNNPKATGPEIEAYYRTHSAHVRLKTEMIECGYDADIMEVAIFALHQRKAALQNMVDLWRGEYFSAPRDPESDTEFTRKAASARVTSTRARVGDKMNKGRRGARTK